MMAEATPAEAAKPGKVRVFVLSGQSNMVGLDPDISFTPAMKKAFPGDEIVVIKDAMGGQPIKRWYKQWQPANSGLPAAADPPARKNARPAGAAKGKKQPAAKPTANGDLYARLMSKVRPAINGKKIDSVSFVWMQGERDVKDGQSAVYADSLRGLIKQLRDDLNRPDMTVVIGRLSDQYVGKPHGDAVRNAQVEVAKEDKLADWVDTDDLNGPKNAVHYTKDGYATLGERFAQKTIELLNKSTP
jgi:hypothetical protein